MANDRNQDLEILGLKAKHSLENLERAYQLRLGALTERAQRDMSGPLSFDSLSEEFRNEFMILQSAYDLLFAAHGSGHRPNASGNNVVSAEMIPGIDEVLGFDPAHFVQDAGENVIDFRRRSGASGGDPELEVQRDERVPHGSPREIEALIEMSELTGPVDTSGAEGGEEFAADADEEAALDHRSFGGFYDDVFEPRKMKSVIGDGQKEVVNIRAANSRLSRNQDLLEVLLRENSELGGALLVQMRENLGVTKHEVSLRTKVNIRYIDGLERDDYSHMPALVYFKGYVSSYLRYLGVDDQRLVQAFAERYLSLRGRPA